MAKIGNEATLILKLAKERMERELNFKEKNMQETDPIFLKGWRQGLTEYSNTLLGIALELEKR